LRRDRALWTGPRLEGRGVAGARTVGIDPEQQGGEILAAGLGSQGGLQKGETVEVIPDINGPDDVQGIAVLLHPHPDFGGSRFHPFVDGLFGRLPGVGVGAVRIDFSSADQSVAQSEVSAAVDAGTTRWPHSPLVLVGYSFGAGIASGMSDDRISGWYLLAPPTSSLDSAQIGSDPRPKAIVVPEQDQYFSPDATNRAVADWVSTTVTVAPDADHFLGNVGPVVDQALAWISRITKPQTE
jgi:uncharacterized protein